MVYKSHYIELWVNGKSVEFESQDSINVRFQNVLFDPTKISSTQAEYSFEFELPCTPNNNKIFNYANDLAKLNKFHTRWDAELIADGNLIFKGSLTLNSVKDKMYHVNLVSVKNYSLEEIFGESTMNEIKNGDGTLWSIPFNGAGSSDSPYTIDYYNANIKDVCFPLVSYGVFQKDAINKDEFGSEYSSKFDIDKYNRWYIESFYPSVSMVETVRKAFEWKGYAVDGDLFQNELLNSIYMSVNLADGQVPLYNLGNPKFGKVDLSVTWTTPINGSAYTQQLNFPYMRIGGGMDEQGRFTNYSWNFDEIQVYDMLSEGSVNVSSSSYMYQPNEHIIVIPSDGFYKITLSGTSNVTSTSSFQANQYYQPYLSMPSIQIEEVEVPINARKFTPFEIQLVRNYDDNIELIKGENNFYVLDGYPLHTTQCDAGYNSNYVNRYSTFPHEKCGSCYYYGDTAALHGSVGVWEFAPPTDITRFGDELNKSLYNFDEGNNMGYLFNDGDVMAYDPCVSPIFICGFTSMGNDNGGGCASVIKNGYSWSKTVSERYDGLYPQYGYWKANTARRSDGVPNWNMTTSVSSHNQNTYNGSFNYFSSNNTAINGQIQCLVHLNKNDVLQLFAVQRNYTHGSDQVQYGVFADYKLSIEAISPKTFDVVRNYNANAPSDFDSNLVLPNFFNQEKKVSEWVQNIADAFNLEILQDGKNVSINTKKKYAFGKTAVDIDDRVNSNDAESSIIDYPRSMAVKYKIDTDEWGFERSAVENSGGDESILNGDDWKKYGDSGYSEIMLNDDSYVTSKSEKSLQFSYAWYQNFNWYEVDYDGQQNPYRDPVTLKIPCISKFTYMIDGYDYEESMKHDGYGLTQRFWFKPTPTEAFVWTETYPRERISIYTTKNVNDDGVNLSYKNTEKSLLSSFFNISAYLSSNYVKVDVYLTPMEYYRLKNGADVRFDKDIYEIVELSGFDCAGNNPTTLKLIKKVI